MRPQPARAARPHRRAMPAAPLATPQGGSERAPQGGGLPSHALVAARAAYSAQREVWEGGVAGRGRAAGGPRGGHPTCTPASFSQHAASIGVPRSALPPPASQLGEDTLADARKRLEGLLASFLSAGL